MFARLAGLLLLTFAGAPAAAAATPGWSLSAGGGVTIPTFGRSNALPHIFKPSVRLEGAYRLADLPLALGVEAMALADGNEHYRVLGVSLTGRVVLAEGGVGSMGLRFAGGVGHGAPILWADLRTRATLLPYVGLGLDGRFVVVADALELGVALLFEQLSLVTLTATITMPLPGG